GALLAAVLEREEAREGLRRRVGVPEDAEDAAGVLRLRVAHGAFSCAMSFGIGTRPELAGRMRFRLEGGSLEESVPILRVGRGRRTGFVLARACSCAISPRHFFRSSWARQTLKARSPRPCARSAARRSPRPAKISARRISTTPRWKRAS